jgi:hypothetical protein
MSQTSRVYPGGRPSVRRSCITTLANTPDAGSGAVKAATACGQRLQVQGDASAGRSTCGRMAVSEPECRICIEARQGHKFGLCSVLVAFARWGLAVPAGHYQCHRPHGEKDWVTERRPAILRQRQVARALGGTQPCYRKRVPNQGAAAATPGVMIERSHRYKGHDNVAHLCPVCWKPARRLANAHTVTCSVGHESCMRCGLPQCHCESAGRGPLIRST